MSQISRRRANQLGNLVRMLELRAINLDASPRVPKQRLGHRFDHARLARSRRPQKQQVPHRTPRRIQPRQKHLIDFDDLFESRVLPHNAAAQRSIKLSSIVAATVRIQHCCQIRSHKIVVRLPDIFPFVAVFFGSSLLISDFVGLLTLSSEPSFLEAPTLQLSRQLSHPAAIGISNPLATPHHARHTPRTPHPPRFSSNPPTFPPLTHPRPDHKRNTLHHRGRNMRTSHVPRRKPRATMWRQPPRLSREAKPAKRI